MSARDALSNALWDNYTQAQKNAFIDAFAHELAEKVRTEGAYWGQQSAAGKVYAKAAALIDPVKDATCSQA